MNYFFRYLVFSIFYLTQLVACGSQSEKSIQKRTLEYFSCEKARDYKCMWSMRVPSFREMVPLDVFTKEARQAFEGWKTKELNLIGYKPYDDNTILVVYEIVEIAPKDYRWLGVNFGNKVFRFKEPIEWWKVDGQWYALEVGARNRFAFGHALERSRAITYNSSFGVQNAAIGSTN